MYWDKQIGAPKSLVDFMKKNGLSSNFSERGKLFHELIGSEEKYLWTMKQNIQLLSRLKIDHLSNNIPQKPVRELQIEQQIPRMIDIVGCAKNYLWHPFDTPETGIDGGWLWSWQKTWKAKLRDNYSWEVYISTKKPFVCADLVISSLVDSWVISLPKKEDPYYWRRVDNIEKLARTNPKLFDVHTVNSTSWDLVGCAVWDIITLTNTWHGRHCGIITEVGPNWKPIKVVNSRFEWVIESVFLSTKPLWKDYNQRDRYDGFFTAEKGNMVTNIIRLKSDSIILSQTKKRREG